VDEAALAVLRELAGLAAERGARLVLLLPPTLADWTPYVRVADAIHALARPPHVRVVDWRDRRGLGELDFADGVHLNRDGAERFSRLLGAELAAHAP
jgi:lysophospholipase L1-like esterase